MDNPLGPSQTLSSFSIEIELDEWRGSGVPVLRSLWRRSPRPVEETVLPAYIFGDFGFAEGDLAAGHIFPNSGFIASDIALNADGFVTILPGDTFGLARIAFTVDINATGGPRPVNIVLGPGTQFLDGSEPKTMELTPRKSRTSFLFPAAFS